MNDDRDPNGYHQKRVQNFKLNIQDDDFYGAPGENFSSGTRGREDARNGNVLHSYSDPRAARQAKLSQSEAAIRAERAHRARNLEKGRKNKNFFRFYWIILVLFTSVLLAQYMITGINDMLAIGKEKVSVTVEIPKKATSVQVAGILKDAGVIRDANFFALYSKLTKADGSYNNGSFKIDTNLDYQAVITALQSNLNRVDTIKVTIKEGMNLPEMAALLEKQNVCSAKDFLTAVNTNDFDSGFEMIKAISNGKERYYKLEGYLFPDTYDFYKDEDVKLVIKKLLNNCSKKLTKQIRDQATAKNMSIDQVITLASMIQAEAADKEDMYKVSSVFHNRLVKNEGDLQRLRSDPTTYYPYRTKDAIPSNLRGTYKSRYDTYTIKGLPPGPICNPGTDAIDAALNPANTNYLYFCHDKNGKAYYATTNARHEANLRKAGLK